jgi:hypothetical protein
VGRFIGKVEGRERIHFTTPPPRPPYYNILQEVAEEAVYRAQIFKLLRTPGIDSMESILCEKSIPLWN